MIFMKAEFKLVYVLVFGMFLLLTVLLMPKPVTTINTQNVSNNNTYITNLINQTNNFTNNITTNISIQYGTTLPSANITQPFTLLNVTGNIHMLNSSKICLISNCSRYIMANDTGILIQG